MVSSRLDQPSRRKVQGGGEEVATHLIPHLHRDHAAAPGSDLIARNVRQGLDRRIAGSVCVGELQSLIVDRRAAVCRSDVNCGIRPIAFSNALGLLAAAIHRGHSGDHGDLVRFISGILPTLGTTSGDDPI